MDRLLSRRQALAAGGLLGLYVIGCGGDDEEPAATTTTTGEQASCVLTPEQTEGPYYIEDSLVRRDVTENRDGSPLELRLSVQDSSSCEPIEGATVEIWHCDAEGVYSGVETGTDETFLRGAQRTDAAGLATFDTIFPGWYQGRAVHIHVKVHVGGNEVHTGQLYFEDADAAAVYGQEPYAARGQSSTPNSADGIYAQGGDSSLVKLGRGRRAGSVTLGVAS